MQLIDLGGHPTKPAAAADLRPCIDPSCPAESCGAERIFAAGKFFNQGAGRKWYTKGFTYGPFAPNDAGEFLPPRHGIARDFQQIRDLGANCVRLYHPPPLWLLDEAAASGLHVFIDVPWQKHRCFFEDWTAQREAIERVSRTALELGRHPATFAISVGNEIPKDIVRFYGAGRIERFIGELIDASRQQAPDCLVTYTNYPSTEFLSPPGLDFLCFNVYLNETERLGPYLDRLQHLAGSRPLILGEFGLDAMRHGEKAQAAAVAAHVRTVFQHGLAGSFVFSYTDDWFTGGHPIDNWALGVTDRQRNPKPAAHALREVWSVAPKVGGPPLPKVSVVVCSYNGAATLEECLRSLQLQDYPSYEVILVDDGSTDSTAQIAGRFPKVRYIHQENRGLSVARNVGAAAATGTIVAYTDSDCVADDQWLRYLVCAMHDQKVDAIGGPNIPPPGDGWICHCVAASPGGPSHVMLDDQLAEHVPGCNMAFDRERLLEAGGFDPQFRVAGDDVDICWRFLDAGLTIGYAASALVWHHRRATIGAYLRQQRGYGRSEAMLYFKHPSRFNSAGQARWNGIIYGEGAVGLPLSPSRTWHGRFGTGLFQVIYRHNQYSIWSWFTLLEWHAAALLLMALSSLFKPLMALSAGMWVMSLLTAARAAARAPMKPGTPWWCRPVVFLLYLLQPLVRSWHRYKHRILRAAVPELLEEAPSLNDKVKPITGGWRDMYWRSTEGKGRHEFLESLVAAARSAGWAGNFDAPWEFWDANLLAGPWHTVQVRAASEELGGPKFFTRVRWRATTTRLARVIGAIAIGVVLATLGAARPWAIIGTTSLSIALALSIAYSRHRALRATGALVWRAGQRAGLTPAAIRASDPAETYSVDAPVDRRPAAVTIRAEIS